MREFLSYVLESFRDATGWSRDNGYSDLNVTANELLNFQTPRGLRMTLSSLATPHFATSYTLGSIGVVDGAISYLYSSVPLPDVVAQSDRIPLPALLRSYRQRLRPSGQPPVLDASFAAPPRERVTLDSLLPFSSTATPSPTPSSTPPSTTSPSTSSLTDTLLLPAADQLAGLLHEARALVDKPALLYGRLYLPRSMLEAYMVKRLAPSVQLQLRAVSDAKLPSGGTVLGIVQFDRGRYGLEGLVSSDGGLLGVRGLYNFGAAAADAASTNNGTHAVAANGSSATTADTTTGSDPRLHGRFSAGGEFYYGTLNKSGGVSLGARFETTVPPDAKGTGTPLTATLTINPLMGNLSAAYAVAAREDCSLATRFDFNVYSYESEWSVGMELWSTRRLAGLVAVDEDRAAPTPPPPPPPATLPSPSLSPSLSTSLPPPSISSPLGLLPERSFQAKLEWRLDDPALIPAEVSKTASEKEEPPRAGGEKKYQGVLKARLDQSLKIGLLWEGRIQSLLFSLGSAVDLHRLDQPFRTLGLEIQFSS